jgi:DNA modification methylase
MEKLINDDNMNFKFEGQADLIYCDYVYENFDFSWAWKYRQYLKEGGIFIVQTDFHSLPDIWKYMTDEVNMSFLCHSVWKNEWGNHPKDIFHQCFDSILFFTTSDKSYKEYKFYPERIQVNKVTKNKGLNPSGRQTKTATAWIDDICLTTTSKERVKKEDGHLVRWQKPLALYDRIIAPFTDEEDLILDPFMGSGSLGLWCKRNFRDYVGIECDEAVFKLAQANIERGEGTDYQMTFSDLQMEE